MERGVDPYLSTLTALSSKAYEILHRLPLVAQRYSGWACSKATLDSITPKTLPEVLAVIAAVTIESLTFWAAAFDYAPMPYCRQSQVRQASAHPCADASPQGSWSPKHLNLQATFNRADPEMFVSSPRSTPPDTSQRCAANVPCTQNVRTRFVI